MLNVRADKRVKHVQFTATAQPLIEDALTETRASVPAWLGEGSAMERSSKWLPCL